MVYTWSINISLNTGSVDGFQDPKGLAWIQESSKDLWRKVCCSLYQVVSPIYVTVSFTINHVCILALFPMCFVENNLLCNKNRYGMPIISLEMMYEFQL